MSLRAQSYNFEYYGLEEGLSHSGANSILQDKRGHLWIGTDGGIFKFDGSEFTDFSEKEGIAGNETIDLSEDQEGNIWMISLRKGITKYNGRNFMKYTQKDTLSEENYYRVIFTDSKNRVWIGSDAGLLVFQNGAISPYLTENKKKFIDPVYEIIEDSKGNIWIGTDNGITVIQGNKTIHLSTKNGLPSNYISAIVEDPSGNYWIGTDNGVVKLLAGSLSNEVIELEANLLKGIDTSVHDLLIDEEKNIWVATQLNGIYIISSTSEITHLTSDNGLSSNLITSLFIDNTGNIWVASDGIVKISKNAFTSYPKIKGLNDPTIYCITEDLEGNIWLGTDKGIYKYDGINITQYTTADGLAGNLIEASITDLKGDLWFGTSKGLCKYNKGKFKTFTTKDGLPGNNIMSLLLDKEGNIWIGTLDGFSKYNYQTFKNYSTKDGLSQKHVTSFLEDSKENMWIGTTNGVNKYKDGELTSYLHVKEICDHFINNLTEDNSGNIWLITGQCIMVYDGLDFKPLAPKEDLSSDVTYFLHNDANGNLWRGTYNGIEQITIDSNGQLLNIKNYKLSKDDKGIECNSGAVYEDSKHNIWFGTLKGLFKYNPTQNKIDISAPIVHLNQLKLFFNDVDWLTYAEKLTKWNHLPANLVLPYDQNHLTFEFSALNLSAPKNVQYQFILAPFDKEWSQPTTKKAVSYSNLPAGDYTFKVKARNLNGAWNQHPTSYSFTITKPWFKEWWLILIVIVVVFFSINKISSFKEQQQQRKISRFLEAKVKERTALIETQKNEKDALLKEKDIFLKEKDNLLEEKEILLKEIHHRVKNNMQVIISLISIQSSFTKDDDALLLFEGAKNRIHSMALIHERMYQTGDLTSIDIQDYITTLTNDLIRTYTINCEIFLNISIYKTMFIIDTLIPLGLLINEIISNALKYAFIGAEKGQILIHLSFDPEEDIYTLLIGDNGIGMPLGVLEKEDGTLGLELIKIFAAQLDGEIKRVKEKGTMYKIKFPPRDF